MITGKLSLLLHLTAIFGIFLLVTILALTLLQPRLLQRLDYYAPAARRRWLWCIILLPAMTGLLAVILVMLPSTELALFVECPACHVHADDYEHLCWYHPLTFKLLSWQSMFLSGMAVFFSHGLLRAACSARRLAQETRKLLSFSDGNARGYTRLDSDIPCAVTLGLLRPRSLISSAIETGLNPQELDVVVAHEAEHVRNRDPLKQFVFRLFAALFPARAFVAAMELAVEQCADQAVAHKLPNRALIAATILKVRTMSERTSALVAGVGVNGFSASILEQRITLLLSRRKGLAFPTRKLVLVIGFIIGVGLLSGDLSHDAVEFLLAY